VEKEKEKIHLQKCLVSIATVWGLEEPTPQYMAITYKVLKQHGMTAEMISNATGKIIASYNGYDKNKLPSPADFLRACGIGQDVETKAKRQWEEIVCRKPVITSSLKVAFSDPVTAWVIEKRFGGLSAFKNKWLHKGHESYQPEHFLKKEFIDAYMHGHDAGHTHDLPCEVEFIPPYFRDEVPSIVGNREAGIAVIEKAKTMIANDNKRKEVIAKAIPSMKFE
jgi:hypothetical protein